jgi:hypothetical protein
MALYNLTIGLVTMIRRKRQGGARKEVKISKIDARLADF